MTDAPRRRFPGIADAAGLLFFVGLATLLLLAPVWISTTRQTVPRYLGVSAVQLFVLGAAANFGYRRSGAPAEAVFPLRVPSPKLVLAWSLLLVGGLLVTADLGILLERVLPKPASLKAFEREFFAGSGSLASAFLLIVLLGPLAEEFLFRGVILHGFLQNYGRRKAIVASAVLFAAYHLNPWQIPVAFVGGILFGFWRAATGSLWPGIVGHVVVNGIAFHARLGRHGAAAIPVTSPPSLRDVAWMGGVALLLLAGGLSLWKRFAKAG